MPISLVCLLAILMAEDGLMGMALEISAASSQRPHDRLDGLSAGSVYQKITALET